MSISSIKASSTAIALAIALSGISAGPAWAGDTCDLNGANSGNNAVNADNGANAPGTGALACGAGATATQDNGVAIGPGANASGTPGFRQGVAVGFNSQATGSNAIAIGNDGTDFFGASDNLGAVASGPGAIAVGIDAQSSGADSSAFGQQTIASGNNSLAVGVRGVAAGDFDVSIGSNSSTRVAGGPQTSNNIAIGGGQNGSAVAPQGALANGGSSIAIGNAANSTYASAVALGTSASAGGTESISIGANATTRQANSTAIGASSAATATDAIALGADATARHAGAVAIGAHSTTSRDNQIVLGAAGTSVTVGDIHASTAAQTGPVYLATTDSSGTLGQGLLVSDLATNSSLAAERNARTAADLLLDNRLDLAENRIGALEASVGEVRNYAASSTAVAVALGGMVLLPDTKFNLSTNFSTYDGATAGSIQFSALVDKHVAINAGVASGFNKHGRTAARVGFAFGW